MNSLATVAQELRAKRGMAASHVEHSAGLSNAYVRKIERGIITEPSPHTLWRLALVYADPGGTALHATYRKLFIAAGYRVPREVARVCLLSPPGTKCTLCNGTGKIAPVPDHAPSEATRALVIEILERPAAPEVEQCPARDEDVPA